MRYQPRKWFLWHNNIVECFIHETKESMIFKGEANKYMLGKKYLINPGLKLRDKMNTIQGIQKRDFYKHQHIS